LNNRRLAVASIAALATVGLAAAGCGGNTSGVDAGATAGASAKASPSLAPKDVLVASTAALQKTSYKFTMSAAGLSGQGSADAAHKTASMSMSGKEEGVSMKMDFLFLNTDCYIKMDLGKANSQLGISPTKWMHLDASTLSGEDLPFQSTDDPADIDGLFDGLVNVTSTDGKTFSGTLDMTKASGDSAPDSDVLDSLGDKAKAVPFTATLDDKGEVTTLKVDGTGISPDLNVDVTFSDYGTPVTVTKPDASQIVEAPDAVQEMFKS
jgi:hypothetical protein